MTRYTPLFLLAAAAVAPAASAQVTDRVIGYEPRGNVYASYSAGSFDKVYDQNGDEQQVGGAGSGSNVTLQRLSVGGSYNVAQAGALGLYVGLDFAMASNKTELFYPAPVGAQVLESGFAPQNLSVFVGARGPAYSIKAGYMQDLGPDYEAPSATDVTIPNSDEANAVVIGGEFYTPFSGLTVTGGANYFLTLKGEQTRTLGTTSVSRDVDPVDYLDAHLGLAYRVADVAELGVQARYLKRFEGETFGTTSVGTEPEGYAFGLVPYLTLSPEFVPAQITVSASATQEYTPYGLTLAGEGLPVGRRGVTVTARFGF